MAQGAFGIEAELVRDWARRGIEAGRHWRYLVRQSPSIQVGTLILLVYLAAALIGPRLPAHHLRAWGAYRDVGP